MTASGKQAKVVRRSVHRAGSSGDSMKHMINDIEVFFGNNTYLVRFVDETIHIAIVYPFAIAVLPTAELSR
jgi:hypothetical protein